MEKIKCTKCGRTLTHRGGLYEHLKSGLVSHEYMCPVCKKLNNYIYLQGKFLGVIDYGLTSYDEDLIRELSKSK